MKISGGYIVQVLNYITLPRKINHEVKNTGENCVFVGFMICTLYQI